MRSHLAAVVTGIVLEAGSMAAPRPLAAQDTSWVARSALYEVFIQDFSTKGNLDGVREGLARIEATGANVVWLMPVHPIGVKERKGELGSPYAAQDYRAINPVYGTPADFKRLVDAAHARGLKVILDWVPDHTSVDHPWVTEHPDWYYHTADGGLATPRDTDGKLTDWTDVAQLDYHNPAMRREMIATLRWWITEFGLDGYRMDVAGFVPYDFWSEAIPQLRASVPRRLLFLAEWGDTELNRRGFDLVYAWDSYKRVKAVWRGDSAAGFIPTEIADLVTMPPGGMKMRFSTNHDETAWDAPPVKIFGGGPGARAGFAAMALLPGRPLLYNGQEVESGQQLPLFSRELIQWNQPHAEEARAFYRRIIELCRTEPDLLGTDLADLETSAPADVIAFRRGDLAVLVNTRDRMVQVTTPGTDLAGARNLLTGRALRGASLRLPAYGVVVLKPRGK